MRHRDLIRLLGCLLVIGIVMPGCAKKSGGPGTASRSSTVLGEIYDMYFMYVKSNSKPPKQLADLKQQQPAYPAGYQAIQSKECIVNWGTNTDKAGAAVLAYEKDVPEKGGSVLMSNGTVKEMTPQEFEAAKKS